MNRAGLLAKAWSPRIHGDDLADWTHREQERTGREEFSVWQQAPDGTRIPVNGQADVHYPLLYAEPASIHDRLAGLDLASIALCRNKITDALRLQLPTSATLLDPLELAPHADLLVVQPTYENAPAGQLHGVILLLLDLKRYLASILEETPGYDHPACFHLDELKPDGAQHRLTTLCECPADVQDGQETTAYALFAFGKTFVLTAHPNASFHRQYPVHAGFLALGLGTAITALLTALAALLSERRSTLERLVEKQIRAMRETEQRYRQLFDSMITGFAVHDIVLDENDRPCDYRFVDVNPAFEHMTGLRKEQLLGKTVLEVMPETERHWIMNYGRVALTGQPLRLSQFSRALGKYFEVTAYAPAKGQFACIVQDITERVRTDQEIHEKNRYLSCLFDLSRSTEKFAHRPEMLFPITARILQRAIERDPSPRVEIEVDSEIYAGGPPTPRAVADVHCPIQTGGRKRGEVRILRDRTSPPVQAGPLECNLLATVAERLAQYIERQDALRASQQRQLQLLQADKLAAVGTMVASVAHEINTPNNNIMLNSSIMQDIWDDLGPVLDARLEQHGDFPAGGLPYSEMRRNIGMLLLGLIEGSERIKAITDDLKSFVGEPDVAAPDEPVHLDKVIKAAARMCMHLGKAFASSLVLELADDLPAVMGNPRRLEQVLINLLANAWQALSRTGAAIYLRTRLDPRTDMVVMEIRDEGRGMPPHVLRRVKEPFFTTRHDQGGSGLGLSIAHGLIQSMGGRLDIESVEGRGTTVHVVLPPRWDIATGGHRAATDTKARSDAD